MDPVIWPGAEARPREGATFQPATSHVGTSSHHKVYSRARQLSWVFGLLQGVVRHCHCSRCPSSLGFLGRQVAAIPRRNFSQRLDSTCQIFYASLKRHSQATWPTDCQVVASHYRYCKATGACLLAGSRTMCQKSKPTRNIPGRLARSRAGGPLPTFQHP